MSEGSRILEEAIDACDQAHAVLRELAPKAEQHPFSLTDDERVLAEALHAAADAVEALTRASFVLIERDQSAQKLAKLEAPK